MVASKVIAGLMGLSALATALPANTVVERQSSGGSPPRTVMYVQTFQNSDGSNISLLDLVNQNTGITHVELAALHINGSPGDINLNDNNPNSSYWDWMWSEAATLQQDGVKVMFMMGGAAQGSYETLCSGTGSSVINYDFYTPLKETIAYHNIDGIDLDIEEDVDVSCPLALLQQLDADFGSDFLLAMAPVASGLTAEGNNISGFNYTQLDEEATSSSRINGKLVTWYNCQFYSGFGDPSTPDDYESIISNGFDPSRVAMGVLDSSSDGGGWYSLSTYQSTISSLKSTYSNFGDVAGWEYYNAGSDDSLQYPWQWVQAISQSEGISTSKRAVRSEEDRYRSTPWPEHTKTLVNEYGVHLTRAVVALNRTSGSLPDARVYLESH